MPAGWSAAGPCCAAERLAAAPGTVVHESDGLVTGAESKAEILCADGSTLTVGPDSTLSMATFVAEPGGTGLLDLISGILRVTLSGRTPWQYFEVRSATAVASVRSTDWIVDASRVKTGAFVVEGEVAVASRQGAAQGAGEVTLTAGQGTDRTEEHKSELQSLMRIPYARYCLKTNKQRQH